MYWPENDESMTLKKGETLDLRYRVLVHSGDHKQAEIAKEFDKYKSE